MDDVLVDVDAVIAIHAEIFGCTPQESEAVLRSRAGLESAVARPAMFSAYEEADVALQAAALAEGIAEGQHFLDGNKRTALVAMEVLIQLHGYTLDAPDETLAEWILELAHGLDAHGLADRLRPALLRAAH